MREETCAARDVIPQAGLKDTLCAADAELTNALMLARETLTGVRRESDMREPVCEEPHDLLSAGVILAEKAKDVNIMLAQLRGLLFG